ncbi:hypothetical protein E2562_031247 [Oryza meyeriana var. granulata]|uniref:Uncharacterized protein n=1 Tax=Oryza meyeriana var. granulata TaxID=110450 RepID=A0A6G1DQL0_9ORYZ|nr:hypothetical protein E2562_031247 [Oryza meyeriana var. granulata]KAF0914748.1 hypothetical protein E2562_031247 [Oryza meyeriana var. granulata]KAF0914749.1 hypothetical protein E2562_031247 [Oryza meyeriana var. granulata]KAF0914750.1 hypothetical protein E2562_031247 [Oryza meyeriana var. granulata]
MATRTLECVLLSGALSGATTRMVSRFLAPRWMNSSSSALLSTNTIWRLVSPRAGGVIVMDLAPAAAGSGEPPLTPAGVVYLDLPHIVRASSPSTASDAFGMLLADNSLVPSALGVYGIHLYAGDADGFSTTFLTARVPIRSPLMCVAQPCSEFDGMAFGVVPCTCLCFCGRRVMCWFGLSSTDPEAAIDTVPTTSSSRLPEVEFTFSCAACALETHHTGHACLKSSVSPTGDARFRCAWAFPDAPALDSAWLYSGALFVYARFTIRGIHPSVRLTGPFAGKDSRWASGEFRFNKEEEHPGGFRFNKEEEHPPITGVYLGNKKCDIDYVLKKFPGMEEEV